MYIAYFRQFSHFEFLWRHLVAFIVRTVVLLLERFSIESRKLFRDWLKILCHFINQSEVKPKLIVTCSHAFARSWRRLHVFEMI